jgi:hypothetical protein
LLDRESRQVIRKAVGGWHDIDDRNVRDCLRSVNQLLRHLRTQIVTGQKDGRIRHVNGFLDFTDMRFARELEDHREKCVDILNAVLASVNMDPVG